MSAVESTASCEVLSADTLVVDIEASCRVLRAATWVVDKPLLTWFELNAATWEALRIAACAVARFCTCVVVKAAISPALSATVAAVDSEVNCEVLSADTLVLPKAAACAVLRALT